MLIRWMSCYVCLNAVFFKLDVRQFVKYTLSMDDINKNKRLIINIVATCISFIVSFGISFFLTPFIVKSLGAAAYGFVGLTNTIISYTELVTVALNALAGRFITIEYVRGRIDNANKYFSSVFFSNLFLCGIILLIMGGCIIYLERIFDIPIELLSDVKALLGILVVNTIIGLFMNVFAIATFIKNRLELSSVRNIIASIIRGAVLFALFGFLRPHLWYIGVSGMLYILYTSYANFKYTKQLTPELKIHINNYDLRKVKELLISGMWSVFSRLGVILGSGLDLVIANLFIGATAMGVFSLTKNVPTLLLSLFSSISAVFAPLLTTLYANGDKLALQNELHKSIRILGFISSIPIICLFVFGNNFYSLWIPGEDSGKLQLLTILSCIGLIVSIPLDALWNIFVISNKLKYATLCNFSVNFLVFITVLLSMIFVDNIENRLLVLAGTRSFFDLIKSLVFLPLYSSYCLNLKKNTFYKSIFKVLSCFLLGLIIVSVIKHLFSITTWFSLIQSVCISSVLCLVLNYFIILGRNDRLFILQKVKHKINMF